MKELESTQEILTQSPEDTAFNYMMWANSLVGTGNSEYQNKFYEKQAIKLTDNYLTLTTGSE